MQRPRCNGNGSQNGLAGRSAVILACTCLVLLIVAILAMAAVPPVNRDALTHHLAVPKLWIQHGGMVALPHLVYSYYPMNIDLLYAVPMLVGNDIIPKYMHFLFALATAWLIFSYLKSRTSMALSVFGALLFLSTPVIVKLSISAYVDLGLIFFSWAAIYYLFKWSRTQPLSLKPILLAAIFCGLGLGTKYNGMIVLFLLTLAVPVMYMRVVEHRRFQTRAVFGYPVLFFLIAVTVFSPWMIRNYRLTGNPVYPLYSGQIGRQSDTIEVSNRSMKPWLQRKLIYRESAWETAAIPLRIFFQGRDDHPKYFDGRLNPILLLFPLLLLLFLKERDASLKREEKLLGVFTVLFVVYASFMVDMRIRYIGPVVPPLVVLTVFGVERGLRWSDGIRSIRAATIARWSILGIVAGFIFLNAAYIVRLFSNVNPLPYITGEISREDYLHDRLPEYVATQHVNRITGNVKVLALFWGRRLYYFDHPVEFRMQHFANTVKEAHDAGDVTAMLKADGFSHFIFGVRPFEQWVNRNFTAMQQTVIDQWLRMDCRLISSDNGYAVFQII